MKGLDDYISSKEKKNHVNHKFECKEKYEEDMHTLHEWLRTYLKKLVIESREIIL